MNVESYAHFNGHLIRQATCVSVRRDMISYDITQLGVLQKKDNG